MLYGTQSWIFILPIWNLSWNCCLSVHNQHLTVMRDYMHIFGVVGTQDSNPFDDCRDVICQLLSSGADLNSPGRMISLSSLYPQVPSYPLIWAINVDDSETVRLLLDNGADPNICCEYVHGSCACWLRPLCHANNPDIVTMLLDAGAEVIALQRSCIGSAVTALLKASTSHPSISQRLIERGADVNITDDRGCTALFWAIISRNDELAARLVQVRWRSMSLEGLIMNGCVLLTSTSKCIVSPCSEITKAQDLNILSYIISTIFLVLIFQKALRTWTKYVPESLTHCLRPLCHTTRHEFSR